MLRSIRFTNFKALERFSVSLRQLNVLVGPNNAGKSTVLDACRALSGCLRFAKTRVPTYVRLPGRRTGWGFAVPTTSIPINLVNAQTNYVDEPSAIEFTLSNNNKLSLVLDPQSSPVLALEEPGTSRSIAEFQKNFPISVATVPTLGPFEEDEELLTTEYVERWEHTRRANRLFRNIWYRRSPSERELFRELVSTTWPGMAIGPVELDSRSRRLTMFAKEGRIDREIAWAGFGFQVWLQFLTHVLAARQARLLIIDEPDIYLHPDLQHRLFHLLRQSDQQVMLATHSVEIINEAEPEDVILIDKSQRRAQRVHDIEGLQAAIGAIGSAQNTQLARLTRSKRIIFFEGQEFKLIRRMAMQLRFDNLASGTDHTFIPIGGFSQHGRVREAAWVLRTILKSSLKVGAIFDRDYRPDEEIADFQRAMADAGVTCTVLRRKEIENYLLDPEWVYKALSGRLAEIDSPRIRTLALEDVARTVDEVTSSFREEVAAQRAAHRVRYFTGRTKSDPSTVVMEAMKSIEEGWPSLEKRLALVPGKACLAKLNTRLQSDYGASLSLTSLVRQIELKKAPTDLLESLSILNDL